MPAKRRAKATTATFFPRRAAIVIAHSRRSAVRGSRSRRIATAACTMPTAARVPAIQLLIREAAAPTNPLGVKGAGECGTSGAGSPTARGGS